MAYLTHSNNRLHASAGIIDLTINNKMKTNNIELSNSTWISQDKNYPGYIVFSLIIIAAIHVLVMW